jgi:hypothetical protein
MKRVNICKFCKKGFSSEKVLASHMCVNKKRYVEKDTMASRMGFRVFQKFYEMTTISKSQKSIEDFIFSKYYLSFVKFGRYLIENPPPSVDMFVEFVIKNSIKMKDWTSPEVYDAFIIDWTRRESVDAAIERSILSISEWCTEKHVPISDFFKEVSPNYASSLIRNGRISPWVIYVSNTADELLSRMNQEHINIIKNVIDPKFWNQHMRKNKEDSNLATEIMSYAGL